MYFDTPKKNSRKNRSNSKAKMQNVSNSSEKITQKDKENNYANIKNGGASNNHQNQSKFFLLKNKKKFFKIQMVNRTLLMEFTHLITDFTFLILLCSVSWEMTLLVLMGK